jgi:hypothetical protein
VLALIVIVAVVIVAVAMMMIVVMVGRIVMVLALRGPMVRRGLVVLAQQVEPVIVAVWGADDGVHVEFRGLRIGEEHAGVVVETR